ncbi:hypothetical protein IQ247_14920, partial [Plectonema cf. radiosum LEGE 06105]
DGGTRGQGDNSQLLIQNPKSKIQNQIVEATGWVMDENGDILFVAGKPNLKKDNFNKVGC